MPDDKTALDIFPPPSEEAWRALVAKTVKEGAEALAARSDEGIAVGPIYRQDHAGSVLHAARPWQIIQRIDLADPVAAKRQLSDDLAEGADGVEIVGDASATARGFGIGSATIESVARSGALADTHLRIDAGPASPAIAAAFARGSGVASLTAAFDPCAAPAPGNDMTDALALARALDHHDMPGAAILADGRPWNDRGAGEAEELAAIATAFLAHLRAFDAVGYAPDKAVARISVALVADTSQFLTIAKLRAVRLILARILEASGLPAHAVPIHAETAWRVVAARDPHTNILRATIAAFAAAVGGADSIAVLPFDGVPGPATPAARRLARNTQLLLRDEAHLARVGDPGAGAGAVEALTDALAAEAWALLQSIEGEGGLVAAIRSGSFPARVAATAGARAGDILHGDRHIVGSSMYPLSGEAAPAVRPVPGLHRLAEPFEAERRG